MYHRSSEAFSERAYGVEELSAWLQAVGLQTEAVYGAMTFDKPEKTTERLMFVCKKLN